MFNDLNTLVDNLAVLSRSDIINSIDVLYESAVRLLQHSSNLLVPKKKKNFYKFWWSQTLDSLMENAIIYCRAWNDAGKPRQGHILTIIKRINSYIRKY